MNELQTFLTLSELDKFFETNGNLYKNLNGIELELTDALSASVRLWTKPPVKFRLLAELPDTDPELSQKMNLRSEADLDRIDEAELWEHYKDGNGYVWADLDELLDTPLEFSVSDDKTLITSYNDNFSDQVDEVWDNVTPFRDYVRNNIQRIYMAVEQKAEQE
jgi:hypothetical protein